MFGSMHGSLRAELLPVLAATQAKAAQRVRHVAWILERMAETVESDPWNDALVGILDSAMAEATDLAGAALATFRETRDCQGTA